VQGPEWQNDPDASDHPLTQASDAPQAELIDTARSALARHEWRSAFEILSAADAKQPLPPSALDLLAQAAWWTGQLPIAIEVRERAFAAALKAGDGETAVIVAINLARDHIFRLKTSTAQAWLKRAEQMLEGVDENPGHGWLAGVKAGVAAVMGNNEESIAQATRAIEMRSPTVPSSSSVICRLGYDRTTWRFRT